MVQLGSGQHLLNSEPVVCGLGHIVRMYIVEQCQGQRKSPGLPVPSPWSDFSEFPSTCLCLSPYPGAAGHLPQMWPRRAQAGGHYQHHLKSISCPSLPAKVNVTSQLQAGPLWGDPILTRPWPKRGSGCRDTHRGGLGNKIKVGNKT